MSQEIKGFNVSGLPNDNHMMFNKMVVERAQARLAALAPARTLTEARQAATTPALAVAPASQSNPAPVAMILTLNNF